MYGVEIEGKNPKGHPMLTWMQVVRQILEMMGMEEEEVIKIWSHEVQIGKPWTAEVHSHGNITLYPKYASDSALLT